MSQCSSVTMCTRYRSKVSQLQGLLEAGERARQEQEKGMRRHASQTQEAQASVTSLTGRMG